MKKEPDLSDLSRKKNQKVLMKIDEMEDIFLNLANLAQHAFFTLMPPSIRKFVMEEWLAVSSS